MISAEQIRFFHDNGYLKAGRILALEEVEEMRAGLDRVMELEAAGGDDSDHEFGFGHRRGGEDYPEGRVITQFLNMWKREAMYARVMHHPVISGIVGALLDTPRVRLWHDQIISKPPGDNGHFEFHQDFYLWPLDEPRMVSCWLALDDVTAVNGCMHVVPASHRDPRFGLEAYAAELEARESAEDPDALPETPRRAFRHEPVSIATPVELKAGECMFHHCLNFHATPPNTTSEQRRAHVMIFMADGVRVKLSQAPGHPLIPGFEVEDGQPLAGRGFPVIQPELWDKG
jgi:ectoine hydroxylase-related dioxygenase (phytanoyl-CoA dioxygenase family)